MPELQQGKKQTDGKIAGGILRPNLTACVCKDGKGPARYTKAGTGTSVR